MNGMTTNSPTQYTHLESLLLFQTLLTEGVDTPAFGRVAEILKNNPLIKSGPSYNPVRLTADALQQLFLQVWREELKAETERSVAGNAALSPESRKRKLEALPTLKEIHEHIYKLPSLINRLYTTYCESTTKELREEERYFERVKHEVKLLERNESKRLENLASQNSPNGSATAASRDAKTGLGVTNTKPLTQTPSPVSAAAVPRRPTSTTPVFPPKLPATHPQGVPVPAGQASPAGPAGRPNLSSQPSIAPGSRPGHSPQPPAGASPVLQAPQALAPSTAQALHPPVNAPRPSISPKPEPGKKANAPSTSPYPKPVATPAQAQQQYQHQQQQAPRLQPAPATTPGPIQARAPPKAQHAQTQHAAQTPSGIQAAPPRPTGVTPVSHQQTARPTSTTPILPPTRPLQPHHTPVQVPRPIASASASPTPPPAAAVGQAPPQKRPQAQTPQQQPQTLPPSGSAPHGPPKPYVMSQPRPPIPEHMIRHAATPHSARRVSTGPPVAPSTPVTQSPSSVTRGFGTKWAPHSTPSTPGPLVVEPESPAYEPVSPPARAAMLPARAPLKLTLPPEIAGKAAKGRASRPTPKGRSASNMRTRRSQSVASHTDEISIDHAEQSKIKDEELTPRPRDGTGDTTADESSQSHRPSAVTPSSVASRVPKRKRQGTPPEPFGKQTHVMWTRGFTKVSSSVLDRISSHRDANMFANPLRERDAPGYKAVVLQPQDFTSIRSAIKNGNKAAVQAASNLPGGDPGTPNVWLPISEDLLPPRAIINSAQLDRELVHMFCNAIMYNPDPDRGPGAGFLRRSEDDGGELIGYQLDENGIVRNTRGMFIEVEKLLGELRSAEKDRVAPAPTPTATRPASMVATPADDTADDEDELAADTEATSGSGTIKRRRIAMRG